MVEAETVDFTSTLRIKLINSLLDNYYQDILNDRYIKRLECLIKTSYEIYDQLSQTEKLNCLQQIIYIIETLIWGVSSNDQTKECLKSILADDTLNDYDNNNITKADFCKVTHSVIWFTSVIATTTGTTLTISWSDITQFP